MTHQIKKYLADFLLLGVLFYLGSGFTTVRMMLHKPVGLTVTSPLGVPADLTLLVSAINAFLLAWLCFVSAKIVRLYYESGNGLRPWLAKLRWATWIYCAIQIGLALLGFFNFAGHEHPFSGSFFHVLTIGLTTLHYLPLLIAAMFLVDLITEMLALRDDAAHTV